MKITQCNGTITVNGKSYRGSNVHVVGNKVIIDGKEQDGEFQKDINIEIHGDAGSIENECGKVIVSGKAASVKSQSGDIECGDVSGSVKTMSGDIECGNIGGSVNTMSGDITHK